MQNITYAVLSEFNTKKVEVLKIPFTFIDVEKRNANMKEMEYY